MQVPFAKPYFSEEDLDQILADMRVILKKGWLTSGKNVETFEQNFASFVGASHGVAMNSCTAALHSIMLSLGIGPGDEVIVPSDTFVATANAVVYSGAKPVFADSDPDTFNISPKEVERKITPRTRALVAVHLAGNPCDMKELLHVTKDYGIKLVEDCAHAHGATYNGEHCGKFGIASAFSFYATKIITTGEGGMVLTENKELAENIRKLRNQGRGGYGPLQNTILGYNYRMPEILSIIGLQQLKHLGEFLSQRELIARSYKSLLKEVPWMKVQTVKEGNSCSYYAFLVRLSRNSPITRDELARRLNEQGVGTSILYHPIHTQPLYFKDNALSDCPVSVELGEQTIALPMFNGMSQDDLAFVKSQLATIIDTLQEQIVTA